MQRLILTLAIVLAVPPRIQAQEANALRRGIRVEVTRVSGKPQTGRFMVIRNDSLFYAPTSVALRSVSERDAASVAFADVKSVRVSRGQNRATSALTKGFLGAGVGALIGALIGGSMYTEQTSTSGWGCFAICSRGAAAALVGGFGGVVGLVSGSIYGASHGKDTWETVALPGR